MYLKQQVAYIILEQRLAFLCLQVPLTIAHLL
jgi:hypothetical protein